MCIHSCDKKTLLDFINFGRESVTTLYVTFLVTEKESFVLKTDIFANAIKKSSELSIFLN